MFVHFLPGMFRCAPAVVDRPALAHASPLCVSPAAGTVEGHLAVASAPTPYVVEATHPRSADAPGFRLHPLKGDRAGQWSVRVSGNWRVVFRFEDGEAVDVDLVDYH